MFREPAGAGARGFVTLQVSFHGVRGSTPCPVAPNARYGGNTSCVVVDVPGEAPIAFDLGTGVRSWGETQPLDGSFRASALITHFHFDHVQGLPFLAAADRPGAQLDFYGPGHDGESVLGLLDRFVRPPYFPVTLDQLRGTYRSIDVWYDDFEIGTASVKVRPVPHVGATVGYRVEWNGRSVAYVSDHQAPPDLRGVADSVLELCDRVDLLIHDAQYTPEDWRTKSHWGHCTVEYAVHVAAEAGARTLALFHHDPARPDQEIDRLAREAAEIGLSRGVAVFAAAEGLTVAPGELPGATSSPQHRRHLGPLFQRGPSGRGVRAER